MVEAVLYGETGESRESKREGAAAVDVAAGAAGSGLLCTGEEKLPPPPPKKPRVVSGIVSPVSLMPSTAFFAKSVMGARMFLKN